MILGGVVATEFEYSLTRGLTQESSSPMYGAVIEPKTHRVQKPHAWESGIFHLRLMVIIGQSTRRRLVVDASLVRCLVSCMFY